MITSPHTANVYDQARASLPKTIENTQVAHFGSKRVVKHMQKTFEVQGEEAFLSASWQWRRHSDNIPFLLSIDIDKPRIFFLLKL